jgi:hypothetical protein
VALVALAAAAAWVPTPPGTVERWYSQGAYPALQRLTTALSNRVPFALFDLLVAAIAATWIVLAVRDIAGSGRPRGLSVAFGRVVLRTAVLAAGLYVAFLLLWGLNYRRPPLVETLAFDAHAVTPEAARALARTSADQLNALYAGAHADGWPRADAIDARLSEAFARAHRQLGRSGDAVVGRPKRTLFDWYFRRTALDGMTDPFFLETLVSSSLLPFERPFVVAHEWSHLAGFADEGDANFLGWLACVQGSPAAQYSGWLFLYGETVAGLDRPARSDAAARLGVGPRTDLAAIRARLVAEVSPGMRIAGWRVYDQYLKANRLDAGVDSYAHVVELVLGVRFGPGWAPQTLVPRQP